ncbi:MAG: PorP/SprF family type IX secretion system membrane protein [Chitinophagaceae bacterium]|nr:PorP/SprF family type IX secretion system membrane protein [Chitinophagaceae bacterium]
MKKNISFSLFINCGLLTLSTNAQEIPQFTQFFYNKSYYNPSMLAMEESASIGIFYRTQWTGYSTFSNGTSGAPYSQQFFFIQPIISNKLISGINITSEQIGASNNIYSQLNLSYNIHIKNNKLAFGISPILQIQGINYEQLKPNEKNDPLLINRSNNEFYYRPDINIGIMFENPIFYAGASIQNVLATPFKYFIDNNSTFIIYNFILGTSKNITKSIQIEPIVFIKSNLYVTTFTIGISQIYNKKIEIGVYYKNQESIIGNIAMYFLKNNTLRISYGIDVTINNTSAKSPTSHEIHIRYAFLSYKNSKDGTKKIIRTPRFRY